MGLRHKSLPDTAHELSIEVDMYTETSATVNHTDGFSACAITFFSNFPQDFFLGLSMHLTGEQSRIGKHCLLPMDNKAHLHPYSSLHQSLQLGIK